MKKRWTLLACAIVVSYCASMSSARGSSRVSEEGKRLFLTANVGLCEKRYADAHRIAEELIRSYAGDCQMGLYLRLYGITFYLLDEDFQQGILRPTPPGILRRIQNLKAKRDKSAMDLGILVWVGNGPGGGLAGEYVQEILDKHPDSQLADWAKWIQIQVREYRLREKYQDKSPQEKLKLVMRDLYEAGKHFIQAHPNNYMIPSALVAVASWGYDSGELADPTARAEAISMCHRVLNEYPSAEYRCAEARRTLRNILGQDYKEKPGCSEEADRIITQFYCVSPELDRRKKYTTQYADIVVAEANRKGEDGWPLVAYILIVGALGVVATAGTMVLRKKLSSR